VKYLRVLNADATGSFGVQWLGKNIDWSQVNKLRHWDPLLEQKGEAPVSVLIFGRPVLDEGEWAQYDGSPAYISKHMREAYLGSGSWRWLSSLNGAFAILILDSRFQRMHVITDIAGVCPVYCQNADNPLAVELSTHPDLLVDQEVPFELDQISVAEFLSRGTVTFPYSYWKGVKTLEHGCVHTWDFRSQQYKREKYFPIEHETLNSSRQLVDDLIQSTEAAISRRCRPELGEKFVLLSGGLDSRIVAAQMGSQGRALTLHDVVNSEYRVVEQLVDTLKLSHQFLQRGQDYYSITAESSPRLTGGTSTFTNDHFSLIRELYPELFDACETLLTGCYADWLFKGIAHNRRRSRIFGRVLPVFKFEPFSFDFFGAKADISEKFTDAVARRLEAHFASIDTADRNAVEARRLFPLFQEETAATRLSLQRVHEWDPPFVDRDVIASYMKVPWSTKKNHRLFEKVCLGLTAGAKSVPNASTHKLLTESNAVHFSRKLTERLTRNVVKSSPKNVTESGIFGQGSWVHFPTYMDNNALIQDKWNSVTQQTRGQICEVAGKNLWALSFEEIRAIDYHIFYNALTFAKWHETHFSKNTQLG
jgi:asparagine synthase (glutamine-hydrolysing)